ncbi:hypothetical protein VTO42DRAFT_3487 [Malbranchea cinnamomea]
MNDLLFRPLCVVVSSSLPGEAETLVPWRKEEQVSRRETHHVAPAQVTNDDGAYLTDLISQCRVRVIIHQVSGTEYIAAIMPGSQADIAANFGLRLSHTRPGWPSSAE